MRTTEQTTNYPIIEPLQIFLLDLLDFLKSGDRQIEGLEGVEGVEEEDEDQSELLLSDILSD